VSGPRSIVHPPHLQDGKAAFRELVATYGGQVPASALTGRGQSRICDYGSPGTPDFPPIDVVDALEDRTVDLPGWPQVTDWLCRRRGGTFLRLPQLRTSGCWGRLAAKLAKSAGDVTSGVCTDLADDNDVSPAEARRRLAGAEEMVRIAVELRAALQARAEEE
jgi:hypothetical protein